MIVHGMIDENVHFRHSARLVAALCDAGKKSGIDYSLLPFPSERHVPRSFVGLLHHSRGVSDWSRGP